MNHAAPGDFQPFLAHLPCQRTAEIDLKTRFRVAEIVRAETNSFPAPSIPENEFDSAFQITHCDIFVYIKSFDLIKSRDCASRRHCHGDRPGREQ